MMMKKNAGSFFFTKGILKDSYGVNGNSYFRKKGEEILLPRRLIYRPALI
jgi:hypothetical protein